MSSRRLDRISRQLEKLYYHVEAGNEGFALYLRRWLAVTPVLPGEATPAARADAEKRFDHFIEALERLGPTSVRASLHADADGQFLLPIDGG